MGNKNEKEEQEKTFVVRDKRFSAHKEGEGDSQVQGETKREGTHAHEEFSEQATSMPEITFTNFLLSLSTSAFIQLGEVEDPITQQTDKNLPLAIDLLSEIFLHPLMEPSDVEKERMVILQEIKMVECSRAADLKLTYGSSN